MKIFTDGARFWGGQIDRIDRGFDLLGHELTQTIEDADLVYANNGLYNGIVDACENQRVSGKVIFNVLDLAPHIRHQFPMEETARQLKYAHAVTCISDTVRKDIKEQLGIDATVIYNPKKPIIRQPSSDRFLALFVGRVNDAEKRVGLGIDALKMLGVQAEQIVTSGGERPWYGGQYAGVTTDEQLNALYNRAEFLISPTRNAFLGLPILEAAAAGIIPVFCKDLDIREEFFPTELFPEYAEVEPTGESIAQFMHGFMSDGNKKAQFKERLWSHHRTFLAEKLSPVGVAQRILNVYHTL